MEKTKDEWKKILTPEQFHVLREKGTERPFTGEFNDFNERGVYKCAGCETELFASETKYESSCGWPSFFDGIEDKISTQADMSHGMIRTEIKCKNCNGHLGHVFNDGPPPTGIRYCVNSLSLKFEKANSE